MLYLLCIFLLWIHLLCIINGTLKFGWEHDAPKSIRLQNFAVHVPYACLVSKHSLKVSPLTSSNHHFAW